MTAVAWMTGAAVASWLVATAVVGTRARLEILFGMIGPLVASSGSWALARRTYRRDPARLTRLMAAAFLAKLVFFGVYVAVALGVLSLRPVPFVVSFTSYFIGLYGVEALLLRRLFRDRQA